MVHLFFCKGGAALLDLSLSLSNVPGFGRQLNSHNNTGDMTPLQIDD
jgi:hypothetical protein